LTHSLDACLNTRGNALSRSPEDLLLCLEAFGPGGFTSPPIADSSQVETRDGIERGGRPDQDRTKASYS
jgi:hypothetical protein